MEYIKNTVLIFFVLALFVSCSDDFAEYSNQQQDEGVAVSFTASLDDGSTRTGLAADGKSVLWSANDKISVFTAEKKRVNNEFTTTQNAALAVFSGTITPTATNYYAIYPYNSSNTFDGINSFTTTLPERQYAKESGYSDNTSIAVAKLGASETPQRFKFRNACAMIKVSFTQAAGNESRKIKRIVFRSRLGRSGRIAVSGGAKVTLPTDTEGTKLTLTGNYHSYIQLSNADGSDLRPNTTYCIMVPPQTYPEGYMVAFVDENNEACERNVSTPTTLKANFAVPFNVSLKNYRRVAVTSTDLVTLMTQNGYTINKDADGTANVYNNLDEMDKIISLGDRGHSAVSDITGIEELINLKNLILNAKSTTLQGDIDLSKNFQLESVAFKNANITSINVSNLQNLKSFSVEDAKGKLKSINFTGSDNITTLVLRDLNTLTTPVDVSQFTELEHLTYEKSGLTVLDVTNNPKLKVLSLNNNDIKNGGLNLANNTELTTLQLNKNKSLSEIDLSHQSVLATLVVSGCAFPTIDVSKNTKLTELHVEQMSTLTQIIGLNKLTNLSNLFAFNNSFTTIDLSKNTKLTQIILYGNYLSELDLTSIASTSIKANLQTGQQKTGMLTVYVTNAQDTSALHANNNSNVTTVIR